MPPSVKNGGFLLTTVWVGLMLAATACGQTAEWRTDRFALQCGDRGQAVSLQARPGGEELLDLMSVDAAFCLTDDHGKRIPLVAIGVRDGQLLARSADAAQEVVFSVRSASRHLALRIEQLKGILLDHGWSLRFSLKANARVRATELDFMTTVSTAANEVRVEWRPLRHGGAADPLGGFALYVKQDDADEDETLLRIWVEEKLPHPKVPGEWTLDRARQWVADWQRLFADRSQMILEGDSLDELRASVAWAEKAQIKDIYLFTQTWRTDNFWPGGHGNWHVNRAVFPNGEDDLRAFSEFVRSRGMRLNLHYVSGGIGPTDPVYVGSKPDRRLASWVRGALVRPANPTDADLVVQPPLGARYPPDLPRFFGHKHVRVDDEIVRVGSFEKAADGTWLLKQCRRGQFLTKAAAHAAGADTAGLIVAYGQNYVPDNDSTLLDEVAAGYAGLINRGGISHTEYDGAEIHCYSGRWGYLKFATKVYQSLDHPVTAHDSSGSAPRCYFEYRLNSTRKLLLGTCPFTHGNWSAPVELASPSRVASTLLDADFVLSQGHPGGAMGICKPEPMFAVSDRSLKAHGLTNPLIETLLDWKAVSRLLTDEQHAKIDATFGRPAGRLPDGSHHRVSRFVQTVRKVAGGYHIVPVCVMTRASGDIIWQQGQEHGAISPRQYLKPGDRMSLENPFGPQPARFIIRVLWAFDPQSRQAVSAEKFAASLATPGENADSFTAGNTGETAAATAAEPNILLQPLAKDPRNPGTLVLSQEGEALRLTAKNAEREDRWELEKLPSWGCRLDLSTHRGVGMTITGDGSGEILLFQIPGRDYVVPITFRGKRYVEIPNGEVAWASGDWGWRMATKQANYANVSWMKIGLGRLPPATEASVLVEGLAALAEIPTQLESPVIQTGQGSLTVKGLIKSGEYLQYEGGKTATVCDENWNRLRELSVETRDYTMPAGWAPVSITTTQGRPLPWLEVQFMTEGEAMVVRAQ